MRANRFYGIIAISAGLLLVRLYGVGPMFHPDVTVKGTGLAGWRQLGEAAWSAQDGEITGTPKSAAGGWLMLDRSLQDVAFYSTFRCTGGCRTGVLLRAEKTADGMKSIYV